MKILRIPQLTALFEDIQDDEDLGDISSYEDPNANFLEKVFGPLGKYLPVVCKELDLPLDAIVAPYVSGEVDVDLRTSPSYMTLNIDRDILPEVIQLPTFLEATLKKSKPAVYIRIQQYIIDNPTTIIDVEFRCFGNHVIGSAKYPVSEDGKLEQYNDR